MLVGLVCGVVLIVVVGAALILLWRRTATSEVKVQSSLFVRRRWTNGLADPASFGFFYTVDDLKEIVDLGLPGRTRVWPRNGADAGLWVDWKNQPNIDLGLGDYDHVD